MKKSFDHSNFPKDFFLILLIAFSILLFCSLFALLTWGASRGSGSYTISCISSPCEPLYLPVTQEEKGWLSDTSTNSVNRNSIIISSAINRLEILPGNTNYILIQGILQAGSTFYVSSASIDDSFYIYGTSIAASQPIFRIGKSSMIVVQGNGNVGIATASPQGLFQVGQGSFTVLSNGNVGISTTIPNGTLHIHANSGPVLRISENPAGGSMVIRFSTGNTQIGQITFNDQSGATIEVSTTQPLIFYTSSTERARFSETGNFQLAGSSITLLNQTTVWFSNDNSFISHSSPTICNQWIPINPNYNLTVDITTTPTAIHTNFVTYNFPQLAGTNAKMVRLQLNAYMLLDADANFGETRLALRKGGSSGTGFVAIDNLFNVASKNEQLHSSAEVPVSTSGGIDYSCRPVGFLESSHICQITAEAYCR